MVHVRTAVLKDSSGATVLDLSDGRRGTSTEWIVEDVDGWYGGSGVRGEKVERLKHGTHVARAWRESRALTVHGVVICPTSDERDRQERHLSGVLWDGTFGEIKCDDGDAVLATNVRLDSAPQVAKLGVHALRFQIPLVADEPWLYGPERVYFESPVNAGVGLEFPLFSRDLGKGPILTFGSKLQDAEPVWNQGNAEAYPVVRVVGDFPGGFRLTSPGKTIEYPWPTSAAAPVEVRMDGAVFVKGANVTDRVTHRGWMSIPPGGSLDIDLMPLQGGSGWAEIHHRDTYI